SGIRFSVDCGSEVKKSVIYTTSAVLLLVFSLYRNSAESKPTIPTLLIRHDINPTEQSISEGSAEEKSGLLVIAPEEKDDMAVSDNRDENALHSDGTSRSLGRRATSKRQNKAVRFKRNTTPNPCVERYQLKLIDRETVVPTVICAEGCKEIKRVYFFKDRDDPLTFAVDCQRPAEGTRR
ncbi:unnamed protein product, partial [Porites evermanni]